MGDGLFWERKCCLSSEKQFPALLGLLLSSSFIFFSGYNRVGKSWIHVPYSVSGCLRHLKLGVEIGSILAG